nr:hypothetical protein [Angustibacter aerolatus]
MQFVDADPDWAVWLPAPLPAEARRRAGRRAHLGRADRGRRAVGRRAAGRRAGRPRAADPAAGPGRCARVPGAGLAAEVVAPAGVGRRAAAGDAHPARSGRRRRRRRARGARACWSVPGTPPWSRPRSSSRCGAGWATASGRSPTASRSARTARC